ARNQDNVSGACLPNRERDRFLAVGFHLVFRTGALESDHCIIDDGEAIFTAGIVRSDYYEIAAASGSFAHQRTLGPITIAPATKNRDHFAFQAGLLHKLASQGSQIAQRIVGVRVIDHYCERLLAIYTLESSWNPVQTRDSLLDGDPVTV